MINQKEITRTIVNGLKTACQCEVIRANQEHRLPPYPFLAYTITTVAQKAAGSYGEWEDGRKEKELIQIWSLTAASDTNAEAMETALKAHEWLSETETLSLSEQGIVVRKAGDITGRDNLISVGYEYRKGFDVWIALVDTIEPKESDPEGRIEQVDLIQEQE